MIRYVKKDGDKINILGSIDDKNNIPPGCYVCTEQEYEEYKAQIEIQMYGTVEERGMKEVLKNIRSMREVLFKAFDTYKSNVSYGIEIETSEEMQEVVSWYNTLLDLPDTVTLENYQSITLPATPSKIEYYL